MRLLVGKKYKNQEEMYINLTTLAKIKQNCDPNKFSPYFIFFLFPLPNDSEFLDLFKPALRNLLESDL